MQQPIEQRAPEREHDPHVQQPLAVVLDARRPGRRRMMTARNIAPARLRRRQPGRVSSAVFSSTRSMMNRMNSGSTICSPGRSARGRTARQRRIGAATASAGTRGDTRAACRRRSRLRCCGFRVCLRRPRRASLSLFGVCPVVESLLVIIADEVSVSLARRSRACGARGVVSTHRSAHARGHLRMAQYGSAFRRPAPRSYSGSARA